MADKPVFAKQIGDIPVGKSSINFPEESKTAGAEGEGDEYPTIVIQCGSEMCRVGFAGEDDPKCEFQAVVGRPKQQQGRAGNKDVNYVGKMARAQRGVLDSSYPIERGIVTNWDDMESIWHYIFKDVLNVDPENHYVLLSDSSVSSISDREKIVHRLFEKFKISGFYIMNECVLALYASGSTDGTVLDIGSGLTQVVPVISGYPFRSGIVTSNLAGSDLTLYMAQLLSQRSRCSFTKEAILEDAEELKKMSCYVAQHFDQELRGRSQGPTEKTYDLPDGQIIKSINIGRERFKCPEGLFKPYLLGSDSCGIHEKIYHSIMKCVSSSQYKMEPFANICVTGGSTMFPGLVDRLKKEMQILAAPGVSVKVHAAPGGASSSWIGGSIIGCLSSFERGCMTKHDYDENGPSFVRRLG